MTLLQEVDRALLAKNLKNLPRLHADLQRALTQLRRSEQAARVRCETAERHAKKRACKEHDTIREELAKFKQRDEYLQWTLFQK